LNPTVTPGRIEFVKTIGIGPIVITSFIRLDLDRPTFPAGL
jgi:hypothetical protein